MNFFDSLQLIGGIVLSVGYVPQIKQIIKTKSAKGLNLQTFMSALFGIALMEFYALNLVANGSGYMFLTTNTLSLCLSVLMIVLIKKFGEKPCK